jgi:hypothetical protein
MAGKKLLLHFLPPAIPGGQKKAANEWRLHSSAAADGP